MAKFHNCMDSRVLDRIFEVAPTMSTADLIILYASLGPVSYDNKKLWTERFVTRDIITDVMFARRDADDAAYAWVAWLEA